MKYHALFIIFEKEAKFEIVGGALWVSHDKKLWFFSSVHAG